MSDFSISNARLVLDANSVSGTQAIGAVTSSTQDTSDPLASLVSTSGSSGQAASVDISKPGELFSKLQKLKTQDPDEYKKVVTDIADKLTKAAAGATGKDQDFLSKLASTFQKAEDGSDLQLPQPPGGGQGGAKSAQALYAQSGQTQQTGGAQHAHKGHHHKPSAAIEQAFQSITDEVNQALGGTASTASTTTASTSSASTSATALAA